VPEFKSKSKSKPTDLTCEQVSYIRALNFYLVGLLLFALLLIALDLVWPSLYRLEIGSGVCFVGVGRDSNFGIVSIRNFGAGVGGLGSGDSPAGKLRFFVHWCYLTFLDFVPGRYLAAHLGRRVVEAG
jgi:hypothetical protein